MGALRLITNRAVMKERAINSADAWSLWDQLMDKYEFYSVPEPPGIEALWRGTTTLNTIETDTYLAAFAIALGCEFVTFDRGFLRYPGLQTTILG